MEAIWKRWRATAALRRNEERQRDAYRELVRQHGNSYRSLHWHSRTTQRRRFEAFLRVGELRGRSVLDIGCGLGDFFVFLRDVGVAAECTGYDIVEELLDLARENCPEAVFECRNVLRDPPERAFDYVFSSGVLAFGDRPFFESLVAAGFSLSRVAFGFNLYQTFASDFFTLRPDTVVEFCERLSPARIEVADDYLVDDVTFFLYH